MLIIVLAGLVRLTCGTEEGADDGARDAAPAIEQVPPSKRGRPRAARPEVATVDAASSETPSGVAEDVHGWPAAEIVVRHPDGRPATGATVYVHVAGAQCENPALVARRLADHDGRVRFPVAFAGAYDVGAFVGPGFSTLLRDVEFPARRTIFIDLPTCARLEIRADGALPETASASVAPANAERISAFPGRGESKYVTIPTRPLADHVDVPSGVPLRVRTSGGIVADPPVLSAPGTVTLRPDGRIDVPLELVFIGPEPPDHVYGVQLTLEAPAAEPPGPHVFDYGTLPRQLPRSRLVSLRAAPGPVELRLSLRGQEAVMRTVFASPLPEGQVHRVEVPVTSWIASESYRLRVTGVAGPKLTSVRAFIGGTPVPLDLGEMRAFTPLLPVGASADGERGAVFVAAPELPSLDRTLELVLVPGALVVAKSQKPVGLDDAWPLTVELADGRPFVTGTAGAAARTRLALTSWRIGVFPPGDVEFVFRFAGREIGRRAVHIVAGPPIEVDVPEIVPPGR